MMVNQTQTEDEINLIDFWNVLVKRKKLIGLIIVSAFVVSSIVSLYLPKTYVSTVTLLPPQQEGSVGMAGIAASQLAGGFGGLGGGVLGLKSPADVWVAILKSRTVQDAIVSRFDLIRAFQVETARDAGSILIQMVKIAKSREDIISITVEDKDPKRAALIASALVEELDRVNRSVVMTSGGRMRTFIEKRLNDQKVELAKIEEELKGFQERNGAVKLDDQSKAIIDAIGAVKGQLMAREAELQTLLSFATPNNPQAELLKSQVDELKENLRELEKGKREGGSPSSSTFIPTARIPDLALQYARLLRDAKVQETLYSLLTQQYEMARIQEAKDSPTIQVLDVAKVPEKRSKPKRKQIVIFSTFAAAFFAVLAAFIEKFVEKVKSSADGAGSGRAKSSGVVPTLEIEEDFQTVKVSKG